MSTSDSIQPSPTNTAYVQPLHGQQNITAESCQICEVLVRTFLQISAPYMHIALDLVIRIIIITCGIVVNLKFLRNLSYDRHNRPVGRNGNLLEPHMTIYAKCQMLFWPLGLLFNWIIKTEVLNISILPEWYCLLFYFVFVP